MWEEDHEKWRYIPSSNHPCFPSLRAIYCFRMNRFPFFWTLLGWLGGGQGRCEGRGGGSSWSSAHGCDTIDCPLCWVSNPNMMMVVGDSSRTERRKWSWFSVLQNVISLKQIHFQTSNQRYPKRYSHLAVQTEWLGQASFSPSPQNPNSNPKQTFFRNTENLSSPYSRRPLLSSRCSAFLFFPTIMDLV